MRDPRIDHDDRQFEEQLEHVLLGRPGGDGAATNAGELAAARLLAAGLAPLREPPAFRRERAWQAVQARIAGPAPRSPRWRLARWPALVVTGMPRAVRAAALAVLLLILVAGIWRSAPAWAQPGSNNCFLAAVDQQACSASLRLAETGSALASRDGATLAAEGALATDGALLVRVQLTGVLPGKATDLLRLANPTWVNLHLAEGQSALQQSLHLTVRDARNRTFTPGPHLAEVVSPDGRAIQAITADGRFVLIDPGAQTIEVLVQGPAPVGDWSVPVTLRGVSATDSPGVTIQGVTLRVVSVAANRTRTAVQFTAQDAVPGSTLTGVGGARWPRQLLLRDDRGREYREIPGGPNTPSGQFGGLRADVALFPALAADARSVRLVVPFVTVEEQTGDASVTVPVAGKRVGDRIPLQATLTLGQDTFQVTDAELFRVPGRPQPQLLLHMALGDWHNGRKLIGPEMAAVDGKKAARWAVPHSVGDVGQYDAEYTDLPQDAGNAATITFRNARLALQGPWQVPVPFPATP